MTSLYTIPSWFFGYDIFLEILFGLITFLVAFYSFKVYKIAQQKEFGLLSSSFLLISLSYFVWSVINLTLVKQIGPFRILVLDEINLMSVLVLYSHILLFLVGLVTLFYMTTKTESDSMYSLLVIISLLGFLFAGNKLLALYTFSIIILGYIMIYYGIKYKQNKNKRTGSIFASFILFFAANIFLMFSRDSYFFYVFAHILELGTFLLLLNTLVSILKNGQKKK